MTHGDLEQWAWTVTNVFPVTKQLVRKDHQETLVSSFLGYTTESDMLQSLQLLKRNPWFHGYKTSVSISKDSKKTPTPAASTQAPPVLPAPPAVRTMVSQGAQCEATTMVSKAVATEVTMVTQEVQTELSGPCISNEAIKTEPLVCPHCGKKSRSKFLHLAQRPCRLPLQCLTVQLNQLTVPQCHLLQTQSLLQFFWTRKRRRRSWKENWPRPRQNWWRSRRSWISSFTAKNEVSQPVGKNALGSVLMIQLDCSLAN